MATKRGNSVSLGSGKTLVIIVDYQFTNSAIKIKPHIQITGGSAWSKKKKIQAQYTTAAKTVTKSVNAKAAPPYNWWFTAKKYVSIANYTTTVSATVAGKTSKVVITSNLKPATPAITANFINDSRQEVKVSGTGQKGIQVNSVTIERQEGVGTASWEALSTITVNSNTGYEKTLDDQTTVRGEKYKYRAKATSSAGDSGYVYTPWLYTYPPDISNVGHTRVSNTQCTVSWEREGQAVDRELITGFKIERSESGGEWVTIGERDAGSALVQTVTYVDSTCSPNNYYKYRVKPVNARGTSWLAFDEDGTEPTYNTPAAPSNIIATFTAAGYGKLDFTNTARTASVLEIQRSDDGGSTWETIDTVDETEGAVDTYLDETGITGSSTLYRLRNGRTELPQADQYSAWATSNVMTVLTKPSAPTLTIPANDTPVNLDNGNVVLSWIHNPNDGTPQEAAQIQYRINGTYVATITLTTEVSYSLALSASRFSPGDVVTWRVRTKGAYSEYSDYSEYGSFVVIGSPQITFTAPENGSTIENLPIELAWLYADGSGTLKGLTLEILDGLEVKKTIEIDTGEGTPGEYTYPLKEFLFDNEKTYTLRVTALSSTGLTATDVISVIINYVYVEFTNALFADADYNEDNGQVILTLNRNEAETEEGVDADIVEAYLYRTVGDNKALVGGPLQEGDQINDYYAPLNVPVTYELLQVADTGEISVTAMEFTFDSAYWFIYYGLNYEKLARAYWNPQGDVSLSRPEKERVRYSGREYPVSYDSTAIEETYGFTGIVDDREELDRFRQLIKQGGTGIWKSADGVCYDADFEVSYSADYTLNHIRWNISIEVTRIHGNGVDR